jgi:TolB-like protein/DNA-binding winged helix-turn-helix (wHTH) protein/cytochrome c-type biogenesis protein CcmH/NrfG
MNNSTNLAERVRFGTFELNVRTGELVSIGTAAAEAGPAKALLREQPFQILRILVERQGKIVTRQEIRQILWPDDTVVEFDRSINVAIAILRKALADDADRPKYIETLARRGYRLIAPVEWQESSTAAQGLPEPQADTLHRIEGQISEREPKAAKHWRKAAVLGASAVILVVVGYLSWRHSLHVTPARSEKIMLAVLPFENLTGDPNKEYLADGLTEETISQLGRLNPSQLGVIARTSVMGYKHKDERLDQIGRDLSVQYVLENSLRQSGDHLRITSQLLQVKDQSHLWSHDYDYRAQDVLTVQENVARAVAREIQLRLTAQQEAGSARLQPVNPEAFDAYLRGHYFFERNTDKDTDMAAKYYERATQLDPSYALAWVGLSRARNWQANQGLIPLDEGRRLSREAIERALALNPDLAAAHSQMGRIRKFVDFDWAGADASVRRAIALEPGNPEYLDQAAYSAAMFRRSDEALALARRAVELDPLNPGSWSALGEIKYSEGQLAEAEADVKKSLELSPDVFPGPILLSKIYVMEGRPQDALAEIERVRTDATRAWLYAVTYAAQGREKETDAALKELIAKYSTRTAYSVAAVYALRNQRDEAFQWLDRAYAQREGNLAFTNLDPMLKNLRSDPRYPAFLKKHNLPN